jgi:hypothetical protein
MLGLVLVPVAIEQYPEIFKESRWILPTSLMVVACCWIVPLLIHRNAVSIWKWSCLKIGTLWTVGVVMLALCLCGLGLARMYRFHVRHLENRLSRGSGEHKIGTQAVVPPPPSTLPIQTSSARSKQINPEMPYPPPKNWKTKEQLRPSKPEIVDFDSSRGVNIFNGSRESIFVLGVVATINHEGILGRDSISQLMDNEIKPNDTLEHKFHPLDDWVTIAPSAGSWEDQWNAALRTYKNCVMPIYYSPSNPAIKQITDYYRTYGMTFSFGEASGVIKYKRSGFSEDSESYFPLKVMLVKKTSCQPTMP